MNPFRFSPDPPAHWQQICSEQRALFHSLSWQRLLELAFGTTSMYGWYAAAQTGLAISIFRAGPFRVGYLGFPVGGLVGRSPFQSDSLDGLERAQLPMRLDCLRVPVSGFGPVASLVAPAAENPETAIVDLQAWVPDRLANLRRDLNKARRSPIAVQHVDDPNLGQTFERLYRNTVIRHGGRARYNERYFRLLIELSREQTGLRCFAAYYHGDIAGFLIVALHGDAAYYLHGASNSEFMRHGTSDLLLHESIVWAKDQSMRCFNLMTSPPGQTTLVRYKEKWGSETRRHVTYTLPIRTWAYTGFRVAEKLNRALHTLLTPAANR
jgi:hypothetical protein